jgi:inhibitor of the pro-sigma K processing machinery
MEHPELWGIALSGLIFLMILFHKIAKNVIRLLLRTAAGGVFLAVTAPFSSYLGFGLGVNLFNALVLGLLGVPGFGLLLLLRWSCLGG